MSRAIIDTFSEAALLRASLESKDISSLGYNTNHKTESMWEPIKFEQSNYKATKTRLFSTLEGLLKAPDKYPSGTTVSSVNVQGRDFYVPVYAAKVFKSLMMVHRSESSTFAHSVGEYALSYLLGCIKDEKAITTPVPPPADSPVLTVYIYKELGRIIKECCPA